MGRKKIQTEEKKVQCYFYSKNKVIDKLGGKEAVQELVENFIEKKYIESLEVEV